MKPSIMRQLSSDHNSTEQTQGNSSELSDEVATLLYSAVQLARNNALTSVKALKAALLKEYTGKDKQINEALTVWANYEKRKP